MAGFLLVPWCFGAWAATISLVHAGFGDGDFWLAAGGGFACWLLVFLGLPKPWWLYVLGHELTHGLWAMLFGGRARGLKVASTGGRIHVTKRNFLIVLAPYFFPFYAAVWMAIVTVANRISYGWVPSPWVHFGLGVTYAFHLTLTAATLRHRQPDLDSEGWVFSAAVILIGNALVLAIMMAVAWARPALLIDWLADALEQTGRLGDALWPNRWRG